MSATGKPAPRSRWRAWLSAARRPDWRRPRWVRLGALAFWVLAPLACLAALGIGGNRLAIHLDARPFGDLGSFVVTEHGCAGGRCDTYGTFTSDDGATEVYGLEADNKWLLGEVHRVSYAEGSTGVAPLWPGWDPTPTAVGMAGAFVFLVAWAVLLRAATREAGDRRSAMVSPG